MIPAGPFPLRRFHGSVMLEFLYTTAGLREENFWVPFATRKLRADLEQSIPCTEHGKPPQENIGISPYQRGEEALTNQPPLLAQDLTVCRQQGWDSLQLPPNPTRKLRSGPGDPTLEHCWAPQPPVPQGSSAKSGLELPKNPVSPQSAFLLVTNPRAAALTQHCLFVIIFDSFQFVKSEIHPVPPTAHAELLEHQAEQEMLHSSCIPQQTFPPERGSAGAFPAPPVRQAPAAASPISHHYQPGHCPTSLDFSVNPKKVQKPPGISVYTQRTSLSLRPVCSYPALITFSRANVTQASPGHDVLPLTAQNLTLLPMRSPLVAMEIPILPSTKGFFYH